MREDRRVGGTVRYYLAHEGERQMVVPDAVRKCVAFLYVKPRGGPKDPPGRVLEARAAGTAFFLGFPGDGLDWNYLVTARHVIEAIERHSADGKVYIRVNRKVGESLFIESDIAMWRRHPEPTVDVAVLGWMPDTAVFDVMLFDMRAALDTAAIERNEIGAGDEVFLTGLFAPHHVQDRVTPIVRIGNIAAMPERPVRTELGPMEAYLIESRSIGGLSGSPVFVSLGLVRIIQGKMLWAQDAKQGSIFYLMGIIHGHFYIGVSPDQIHEDLLKPETINMGIAIVTPIQKVVDFINRPEEADMRKKAEAEAKKRT